MSRRRLHGTLDLGERGEALAQALDLLVDVGIGDLGVGDLDRDRRDVGQLESGRMSSSAVISIGSPSLNLVRSISGWLSGWISCSWTAWLYHCGRALLMASSSTTVRPTRWSTTAAGTLPLRKPGTVTCEPIVLYASSRLGSNSSNGTSMVSLIRVGLRDSVLLFTWKLLQ